MPLDWPGRWGRPAAPRSDRSAPSRGRARERSSSIPSRRDWASGARRGRSGELRPDGRAEDPRSHGAHGPRRGPGASPSRAPACAARARGGLPLRALAGGRAGRLEPNLGEAIATSNFFVNPNQGAVPLPDRVRARRLAPPEGSWGLFTRMRGDTADAPGLLERLQPSTPLHGLGAIRRAQIWWLWTSAPGGGPGIEASSRPSGPWSTRDAGFSRIPIPSSGCFSRVPRRGPASRRFSRSRRRRRRPRDPKRRPRSDRARTGSADPSIGRRPPARGVRGCSASGGPRTRPA